MAKQIIFDFDGTLVPTLDLAIEIYNAIAPKRGYGIITTDNLQSLRRMSPKDILHSLGIPLIQLPFLARLVRRGLASQTSTLRAIEGVGDALRTLKARGYGQHVVSSNSLENILCVLANSGITEFDEIRSVLWIFGKHAGIADLIKGRHWQKSDVIYVGDEVRDIEAARKAGVKVAAVTWGYNEEEILQQHNPDFLLRNPAELVNL